MGMVGSTKFSVEKGVGSGSLQMPGLQCRFETHIDSFGAGAIFQRNHIFSICMF